MSLVRLLTTGKSLVGLKETENRYRVTRQRLLPKFEGKRNPFGTSAQPQAEGPQDSEAVGSHTETKAAAETPAPANRSAGSNQAGAKAVTSWLSRVLNRIKSVVCACRLSQRGTQPESGHRRPNRLMQAELSLEMVKVVRNDLSDSDVEIVASKRTVPAKGEEVADSSPDERSVSPRWAKVAGRLFGATKP